MKNIADALSKAQGEFKNVYKGSKNPHFGSKYASLDSIVEMARPILARHGLAVFHTAETEDGVITITSELIHSSGEHFASAIQMKPKALDPQSVGGCITYGRRYGLGMLLGIVTDEDLDGEDNADRPTKPKTEVKSKTDMPVAAVADIMRLVTMHKKNSMTMSDGTPFQDSTVKDFATKHLGGRSSKDWTDTDTKKVAAWLGSVDSDGCLIAPADWED